MLLSLSYTTMPTLDSPNAPTLQWNLGNASSADCFQLLTLIHPEDFDRVTVNTQIAPLNNASLLSTLCSAVPVNTLTFWQAKHYRKAYNYEFTF